MKYDQLLHGRERGSASSCYMGVRRTVQTNCYMGVRGTVRATVTWVGKVKCKQLLHGSEWYSATNCYMGVRGTVQLTVTGKGEVKCD